MKYLLDKFPCDPNDSLANIRVAVAKRLGLATSVIRVEILRRRLSWTGTKLLMVYDLVVDTNEFIRDTSIRFLPDPETMRVKSYPYRDTPVIVGAGFTGLYLALRLAQSGANPIVLERHPETLNSNKTLQNPDKITSYGGFFGRSGGVFMHDSKLLDEEIFQRLVRLGRIQPSSKDRVYFLTPEDCVALTTSFVKEIRSLGGQVLFDAQWIGNDYFLGKLKRVHYLRNGKEETLKTRTLVFTNGYIDHETALCLKTAGIDVMASGLQIGVLIEYPWTDMKTSFLKGQRPTWPEFFIHESFKSKNGRGIHLYGPFSMGEIHAHGPLLDNEIRLANDGVREQTAKFIYGIDLSPAEARFVISPDGSPSLHQMLYRKDKPLSVPVESISDFVHKSEPWKITKLKSTYKRGIFIENLHTFLPDNISDAFQYGLVHLAKYYPMLSSPRGLVYGFLESSGCGVSIQQSNYCSSKKGVYVVPPRQTLSMRVNEVFEAANQAADFLLD